MALKVQPAEMEDMRRSGPSAVVVVVVLVVVIARRDVYSSKFVLRVNRRLFRSEKDDPNFLSTSAKKTVTNAA